MNRWQTGIRRWFWPVLALGTVSLHFWFPESPTGVLHDTYSVTAQGQKAFYRLVARHPQNRVVQRNRYPLTLLMETLHTSGLLCILGPERQPTREEWSAITDWIRNGGTLLYAFRGDKPQEVPWLNVKYHFEPADDDETPPETALVTSDDLTWWTDGRLESASTAILVTQEKTLQAVLVHYGAGQAVFVASALPFSNQSMTYGDNSILAIRLLESARIPEFVNFDESLNSSGAARTVGILFDPLLRPVTIQILILTVLFGWWQTCRFGPLTLTAHSSRQNIVEHSDMVGNLYWKSQAGHAVLKAYFRQLSGLLQLRAFRGKEDRVLEPIARRSGRDLASLRHDLREAGAALRSKQVDRRTAARLIRRLSQIRRAALVKSASPAGETVPVG